MYEDRPLAVDTATSRSGQYTLVPVAPLVPESSYLTSDDGCGKEPHWPPHIALTRGRRDAAQSRGRWVVFAGVLPWPRCGAALRRDLLTAADLRGPTPTCFEGRPTRSFCDGSSPCRIERVETRSAQDGRTPPRRLSRLQHSSPDSSSRFAPHACQIMRSWRGKPRAQIAILRSCRTGLAQVATVHALRAELGPDVLFGLPPWHSCRVAARVKAWPGPAGASRSSFLPVVGDLGRIKGRNETHRRTPHLGVGTLHAAFSCTQGSQQPASKMLSNVRAFLSPVSP